jgi:hypothetical protein
MRAAPHGHTARRPRTASMFTTRARSKRFRSSRPIPDADGIDRVRVRRSGTHQSSAFRQMPGRGVSSYRCAACERRFGGTSCCTVVRSRRFRAAARRAAFRQRLPACGSPWQVVWRCGIAYQRSGSQHVVRAFRFGFASSPVGGDTIARRIEAEMLVRLVPPEAASQPPVPADPDASERRRFLVVRTVSGSPFGVCRMSTPVRFPRVGRLMPARMPAHGLVALRARSSFATGSPDEPVCHALRRACPPPSMLPTGKPA